MCGLVGLFLTSEFCIAATIDKMRDTLVHRGPDDAGTYLDGSLGLGHRRLSIIDIGGGHQPMTTPDGRFTIAFNGEIYNYRELRRELELGGVRFRSNSDTEVILQLHAAYGDSSISRLNGIFAYALWDSTARRLLLVRDRAGIKPLYYAATSKGVAFASEAKALFKSGIVAPRLNPGGIAEYLTFRHVAGAEGLFAGVRAVPPGHSFELRDGAPRRLAGFWSPTELPEPFRGSLTEATDVLSAVLQKSVARQLVADVPVGTFCSGGIDSSLVTAIAARLAPGSINTYSVGFDVAAFDESHFARMASRACGTHHHEIRVSEAEFADALPTLIWHHDFPLNFANSVHIFAVSRLAKREVTVVLTGEGADELFGGYPRYYIARLLAPAAAMPERLRRALGGLLHRAPEHRLAKLGTFLLRNPSDWLLLNNATANLEDVERLVGRTKPMFAVRQTVLAEALDSASDQVTALAMLDFRTYLGSILDRQDKMSMAASVEARVPFLDNQVIDFARSLPLSYRQTLLHRKRVLKDVALRYLPAEIVHRRKSGFGVPLPSWFAGSGPIARMTAECVNSGALSDLMDTAVLRGMAEEHRSGKADYSDVLWSALNLHHWRQCFGV